VHPHIANTGGYVDYEEIEPYIALRGKVEYPGDDAEEVEDLVPIADACAVISPLAQVHCVIEDRG
jgi:hypothetical protein